MELLIVRHAVAEERSGGRSDARRRLTADGRRRMERAVDGLLVLGLRCDRAWHSPWTRAAQTAALLAPLIDGETTPRDALARAPDDALLAELARAAARRDGPVTRSAAAASGPRLALVGHQPWLGELVTWLALSERSAGRGLRLGKGGVAWLVGRPEPGGMELRALLPPRALRHLGRARR